MNDSSPWEIDGLKIGAVHQAVFELNPKDDSGYRYRSTGLDGRRAPKVVLCDDPRIRPGVPCMVRILRVTKPQRTDRGTIEVEFVSGGDFRLEGVYLDPVASKKLQILLDSGLNILLDGPQGCGKTVLARSIAVTLGLEFVFFNCGAVIEASDFLASIQVRASDSGQPVTEFVKTEVLLALEEAQEFPGRRYLVFLDEFNRCQESARNMLMPALDSTRRVFNPISNQFIPIRDNVQFVAAINRGDEFSATFGIDAAQLDRFAPLQLTYMPPEEEVKLLRERYPLVSAGVVKAIVRIANLVREARELSSGLSVRATEEACTYLQHELMKDEQRRHLPDVLQSSFCGRYSGRYSDPTTDAGAVWAIVQRSLRTPGEGST